MGKLEALCEELEEEERKLEEKQEKKRQKKKRQKKRKEAKKLEEAEVTGFLELVVWGISIFVLVDASTTAITDHRSPKPFVCLYKPKSSRAQTHWCVKLDNPDREGSSPTCAHANVHAGESTMARKLIQFLLSVCFRLFYADLQQIDRPIKSVVFSLSQNRRQSLSSRNQLVIKNLPRTEIEVLVRSSISRCVPSEIRNASWGRYYLWGLWWAGLVNGLDPGCAISSVFKMVSTAILKGRFYRDGLESRRCLGRAMMKLAPPSVLFS